MVEVGRFVDGLKAEGAGFFAGMPDSLLKSFCAYVTDNCDENHAIREGELDRGITVQNLHNIQPGRGRPELMYDLDVMISVGYRVKSPEGVRFRRWATRILREMLLNRLDEIKRIAKLERRMDAAEGDIKQIKGGMNYLVQQLSAPSDPPRRRIGFGSNGDIATKPYGKKLH